MTDRAEDAARRLRGESCQTCDHYALVTACCWKRRDNGLKNYYRECDDWCRGWTSGRKAAAASLDELVRLIGIERQPGESDSSLRQRARAAVEDV